MTACFPFSKRLPGKIWASSPRNGRNGGRPSSGYLREVETDAPAAKPADARAREWIQSDKLRCRDACVQGGGRATADRIHPGSGDRVLSQNVATGKSSPFQAVHPRRSSKSKTARSDRDPRRIGWAQRMFSGSRKPGEGWTMTRNLGPRDRVRTLGRILVTVTSKVDESGPQVFSLEVAQNHDFFVGGQAILVHDAGLVQPVDVAFDRVPELASAVAPAPAPAR